MIATDQENRGVSLVQHVICPTPIANNCMSEAVGLEGGHISLDAMQAKSTVRMR